MAGSMVEVAKATVTLVPNMSGAHAEITQQLTGITKDASEKAGDESGSTFGSKFASAVKGSTAVIGAAIAGATAAAVATGKAFVGAAKDVAAYGDEVDKTSQKLGLSASAYQEWDYVMKIAGTEMSSMTTGLKTLTNKLDDAKNGSESAQAMFAALGLSLEDLQSMSREDLFAATITGFQGMADSTERAALANDLFGKSGQNLAPLFNMTAEETAALIDQANEYGMVMDDTAVKASADFTDSMTTLKSTLTGLKNSLMGDFMPGLTQVTNGLAAVFAGDEGGIGQIEDGLGQVITNVQKMAPRFFSLASTLVSSILAGFAPMLPGLVSELFNFINQGIITFTGMIPQLTPVITAGLQQIGQALFVALPVLLSSLLQMAQDLVVWLASGENVKTLVDGIIQLVSVLATQLSLALPIILPAIVSIISQVADSLTEPDNVLMIVNAALTIVGAVVVALINAVPEIIKLVVGVIDNLSDLLAMFLDWASDFVANALDFIITNIKTWFGNLKNGFINAVNFIREKIQDIMTNAKTSVGNALDSIISNIKTWFGNLKNGFINAGSFIREKIQNITDNVKNLVSGVIEKIKELPEKVVSIGSSLVEGLWSGISSKVSWVQDRIAGMGESITNAIKGVFGIASPSKVWDKEIGTMLPPGLYNGFEKSFDQVKEDIADDMSNLTATVSADVAAYGTADAATIDTPGETINSGGNIFNIYAAEGQDINALADVIADKLEEMTEKKRSVYA